MPATMIDLAKRTGLCLATISKYVNGGNVLEPNRIAIEEAIQTLDYHVNEIARGLKSRRSMTVGILTPNLTAPFCMRIVSPIANILTSNGYGTVICDSRLDLKSELENARFLVRKKVDGVISIPIGSEPAAFEYLRTKEIPFVLIDKPVRGLESNLVQVANRSGSFKLISKLTDMGHRRIGIVSLPREAHTGIERLKGYTDALESRGIPVNPEYIAYGKITMDDGYVAAKSILDAKPSVTAIVVFHDEMTFGVLKALHEKGLKYPDDVSIVGFDIYDIAEAFNPVLSDVIQPLEKIGRAAAELLIGQLRPKATTSVQTITFEMELRLRGSIRTIY